MVGSLCVVIDAGFYYALASTGMGVGAAKACSYVAGVVAGFLLNKRWTFESHRHSLPEAVSYLALYAVTLAVNVGCNHWVLDYLGADRRGVAFLFATGVTTVLNFLGLRLATFRGGIADRRERADEARGREVHASASAARKAG